MSPAAPPPEEAEILAALLAPAGRLVEPGCDPAPTLPEQALLALALRTITAWRLPLTPLVTEALHHRMGLGQERRLDIHIALQEALTNALLHGNLGLGSELRGSFAGLGLLQEKIETGLSDPLRANRPVVVVARPAPPAHLWLEVRDYGQGFFPSGALPEGPAAPHAPRPGTPLGTPPPPHGRGLGLIRCLTESCEWRQESRTLAMLFPLAEAGGA